MEEGVWRTVSGRKVFIRSGQSLAEAMNESGKFYKDKKVSKKEYGKLAHLIDTNIDKWQVG